jgi:hypothetical protein
MGGGSMWQLVFESETAELLLLNAPWRIQHSFHVFKSSPKNHRTTDFGMPSVSAINQDITFRSSLTILSTVAMLSSVNLLWADHCFCCPTLTLYPLKPVCATQKLLFDLMLHHCKPSEELTLQQHLIATHSSLTSIS